MVHTETIAERAVSSEAAEADTSSCSPEWCMPASRATHMWNEFGGMAYSGVSACLQLRSKKILTKFLCNYGKPIHFGKCTH